MTLSQQLDQIDRRLERVCLTLGRVLRHPPRTEQEILDFESQFDIRLPEDYRAFIMRFGDGGAILRALPETLRHEHYDIDPSVPFPHTENWNPEHGEDGRLLGAEEPTYGDARWISGFLILGECNYGAYYGIVVDGPSYGEMWIDDREDDQGIRRMNNDYAPDRTARFLDWIGQYLDTVNALARMDSRRLV